MTFRSETFLDDELSRAESAAYTAVEAIAPTLKAHFGATDFSFKTGERDLVTSWDLWGEEALKTKLSKFNDDIGFLTEEAGAEGSTEVYWSIDAIDGTAFYVRGEPRCMTQIALVDHGVPVVAMIRDFINGVNYSAVAGDLARRSLIKPISVSQRGLSQAYLEVYTDENTPRGKALASNIEAEGAYLLRHAAAAYTLSAVASGVYEGFVSLRNPYGTIWDMAPGALLIHAAGGIVCNVGEEDYNVNNMDFIASNPTCFTRLHELALQNQAASV